MNLIKTESKRFKAFTIFTLYCFILQIIYPLVSTPIAFGQSGAHQLEASGMSLNTTDELVNKFTGDFSYSIPLMDVEGYPITISYNQNYGMESEASWVGLGWNLNCGSVSRQMRGLPDDFNGSDIVNRTYSTKDNKTVGKKNGLIASVGYSSLGVSASALWGKYTNSYNGYGKTKDIGLGASFSTSNYMNAGMSFSRGYSFDDQNGAGRSTSIGLSLSNAGNDDGLGVNLSWTGNFNSRAGKDSYQMSGSIQKSGSMASVPFTSVHSLGSMTSVPKLQFGTTTTSSTNQYELGTFVAGGVQIETAYVRVNYETTTKLRTKDINQSSFGYLHFGKRKQVSSRTHYPIMDYNFTHISELSEESKKLPFSAPTYDMFTYTVAGSQGQFRAQRQDVGTLRDATIVSDSKGKSNTLQIGLGIVLPTIIAFKLGYNHGDQNGIQESGDWMYQGAEDFEFTPSVSKEKFDTPVFFKSVGEATPVNLNTYNNLGGITAVARTANKLEDGYVGLSELITSETGSNVGNTTTNYSQVNGREPIRATVYNMRTAKQRAFDPLSPSTTINHKGLNTSFDSGNHFDYRVHSYRKPHHISSPEIITPDGMRYVYDIPVYSIKTVETLFSAAGLKDQTYIDEGLVHYYHGVDDSKSNSRGKMNMFDQTTTPSYAHSFMLTELYSPDYVDVDQNGPSQNDQGNYYKFNYTQVYGENNKFSWRKPYSGGVSGVGGYLPKAYFLENFKATENDDIGSYTYGEKEVYLVHSIESKNMVAEFTLSPREDSYALDAKGFIIEDKPGYKLDKIELYNKNDRKGNPNAVPIQTVEFEYDYSLCPEFPLNINNYTGNGETGKLTLIGIRFKNGNSEELSLAPYIFDYGSENEAYNPLNVDRWGNYKPNVIDYPNYEYPYALQDELAADSSANNWKLKRIKTPQNGVIQIDYEADEYRFVQDKRVMNHYGLKGMTTPIDLAFLNSTEPNSLNLFGLSSHVRTTREEYEDLFDRVDGQAESNSLWYDNEELDAILFGQFGRKSGDNHHERLPNNVLIFELEKPYIIQTGQNKQSLENEFKSDYLTKDNGEILNEVYCKTRIRVDVNENKYETIPTFSKISSIIPIRYNMVLNSLGLNSIKSYGLVGNEGNVGDEYKYGYVVLDLVGVKDVILDKKGKLKEDQSNYNLNPIHKTALQFSKRHLPEVIYADCQSATNCVYKTDIDRSVIFGGDVNDELNKQSFCVDFDINHSFVRLFKQNGIKKSSNARVRSITYSDNWDTMTDGAIQPNEEASNYTWVYEYNDLSDSEKKSSFGVAAYEPQIGKDENPFYQWTRYENIVKSYPDESMFTEEPFAEILFPSPVIGYSEVKVKFQNPNPFNNTGESVTNYYTAYDFPTVSRSTDIRKVVSEKKLGVLKTAKAIALTQGYSIQTNNFHGQIKGVRIFDEGNNLQSKTKYNYKPLGSKIDMLDRSANVSSEYVATEVDIYAESRYIKKTMTSITGGAAVYLGWQIPIPFPVYFNFKPAFSLVKTESGFYTNTFNKIINHSAIVESVETEYLGSHNSAKNIAYDKYSGNVLVSSLKDEYEDELIKMSYPAHWRYDNFRNNHKSEYSISTTAQYGNVVDDPQMVFTPGDVVSVDNGSTVEIAQVLSRFGNKIHLIDVEGPQLTSADGQVTVSLIKSIRKNRLGLSMQSITTKDGSFLAESKFNPRDHIISNTVLTFEEGGSVGCNSPDEKEELLIGSIINPYKYGIKGIYRIANNYAFQSPRSNFQNPHGSRFDGEIEGYMPFYDLSTSGDGSWKMINEINHPNRPTGQVDPGFDYFQNYRKLGTVAKIDEFGKVIQGEDQIKVNSTVLFGYNNKLKMFPVAQAVNAEQNEIAFDGFEDYSYNPGLFDTEVESHFDFNFPETVLSTIEKHSGLKSLQLGPNKSVEVKKVLQTNLNIEDCEPQEGRTFFEYSIDECDCISPFNPGEGKYLLSAWVKVGESEDATSYSSPKVVIDIDGTPTTLGTSGRIIDGWQKIEGEFIIPDGSSELKVALINNDGGKNCYFDDLRIHPYLAGMTTTVYDPNTLLPMASHDGYNYTTFYNYNENYELTGIKVETIDGVKSISSSDRGFVKSFKEN